MTPSILCLGFILNSRDGVRAGEIEDGGNEWVNSELEDWRPLCISLHWLPSNQPPPERSAAVRPTKLKKRKWWTSMMPTYLWCQRKKKNQERTRAHGGKRLFRERESVVEFRVCNAFVFCFFSLRSGRLLRSSVMAAAVNAKCPS